MNKTAISIIVLGIGLIIMATLTVNGKPYYAIVNAAIGGWVIVIGIYNRKEIINERAN